MGLHQTETLFTTKETGKKAHRLEETITNNASSECGIGKLINSKYGPYTAP